MTNIWGKSSFSLKVCACTSRSAAANRTNRDEPPWVIRLEREAGEDGGVVSICHSDPLHFPLWTNQCRPSFSHYSYKASCTSRQDGRKKEKETKPGPPANRWLFNQLPSWKVISEAARLPFRTYKFVKGATEPALIYCSLFILEDVFIFPFTP